MANGTPAALLLIYVGETDTWGEARIPLYEAIVEKLLAAGIDGATVNTGVMGYGANRRLHRKRLFGVADDRPVTISAVDTEQRLREAFEAVRPMVGAGLAFLAPGEILA